MTDEKLMLRLKEGDVSAFEALAEKYLKAVVNYIYMYVRNRALAEDLTQDVFLRVLERRNQFHDTGRFAPWLYRIARNLCCDEFRKKRYSMEISLNIKIKQEGDSQEYETLFPDKGPTPRDVAAEDNRNRYLAAALEQLDDLSREIIVLRHFHGLTGREVAEILGIAEGTVSSRSHRALRQLRALLERMGFRKGDI
jgi:RNA polymerase sigma-70 factor (ECF subfamily)